MRSLLFLLLLNLVACSQPESQPDATADVGPVKSGTVAEIPAISRSGRVLDPGYAAADRGDLAPLLEGIGPVDFPISTDVPAVQSYFNQALTFSYGFNHAEAARSFRQAAELDETCGICWWGVALVLGPNINAAMDEAAVAPAWEAVTRAVELRAGASDLERALIDAVSTRYSDTGEDREALDAVYAGSMRAVMDLFTDNLHVKALYAESLMDLYPWSYWNEDGSPKEHTDELVGILKAVMAADPSHPGALHLWIHVMEQYTPDSAVAAADALGSLVPVAGHLVHMPSHIYLRVGRYHDAVTANQRAALADEDYLSQCDAQGFYPAGYYPHNIHFLWYAAMMEGQKQLAIESAERLHQKIPYDMAKQFGAIQRYLGVRAATYVRFGMWEEALAEPEVAEGLPLAAFMRSYARGVALAATGVLDEADAELERMRAVQAAGEFDAIMGRRGDIGQLLSDIAISLVEAEISRAQGDDPAEIEHLRSAIAAQDRLPYTEPPYWHFPVRQALGSTLLRLGDVEAAAAVFAEDLEKFPDNGWSLYGLREANARLGLATGELDSALVSAWQHADIEPTSGP